MAPAENIATAYRRYITMIRGRALRILGNEEAAADVAQEAFVRLMECRHKGTTEENTAAFLYRVTTNLALNRLRDNRRRRELLDARGRPPLAVDDPTDCAALRKVLSLVRKEDAEIAAYYYVDGVEQAEIAELLGIERRTVGRRLERFCTRARKLLAAEQGEAR